MRRWVATLALILMPATAALGAVPSSTAKAGMEGVWIFDKAPPNPSVTMMEIGRTATGLSGRVTTDGTVRLR